jgi:hypothetical protein
LGEGAGITAGGGPDWDPILCLERDVANDWVEKSTARSMVCGAHEEEGNWNGFELAWFGGTMARYCQNKDNGVEICQFDIRGFGVVDVS